MESEHGSDTRYFDGAKNHNVGDMVLRVSNFGMIGAHHNSLTPWPSLEYPKGSGIDWLYTGALWVGAKKLRKNEYGHVLYFKYNPLVSNEVISKYIFTGSGFILNPEWDPTMKVALDTLVTVGYDGDWDIMELLPAWNPLDIYRLDLEENYTDIMENYP
jgi:hypothetical protein